MWSVEFANGRTQVQVQAAGDTPPGVPPSTDARPESGGKKMRSGSKSSPDIRQGCLL
jgi:hypothetical protein